MTPPPASSLTFEKWKKVPIPIITSIYFFNITNSEDLMNEAVRPVVQEIGMLYLSFT